MDEDHQLSTAAVVDDVDRGTEIDDVRLVHGSRTVAASVRRVVVGYRSAQG